MFLKPFFMVNIGPPFISPLAFTSRNLKPSIHSENFGRKAEACGDPHPDQSARAAGNHRRRDTDDITCTDGRSKRSHQRRERRDVTAPDLGRGTSSKRWFLMRMADFSMSGNAASVSCVDTRTDQKTQHDRPPYEAVKLTDKLIDLHHIHCKIPLVPVTVLIVIRNKNRRTQSYVRRRLKLANSWIMKTRELPECQPCPFA